jgi:hypothetical protein
VRAVQVNEATLSPGLDGEVKTIYSAPPPLPEHPDSEDLIVNTARIVDIARSLQGYGAFVRTALAEASFRGCANTPRPGLPMSHVSLARRDEHRHPGEGSA